MEDLRCLHALTSVFDEVHDFTVPSEVTSRIGNTYDGRHYGNEVNARVTRRLVGHEDTFGVRVDGLTLEGYRSLYTEGLRTFRAGGQALPSAPVSGPPTP